MSRVALLSLRRRRGGSLVFAPMLVALITLAALFGSPAGMVLAHAEVIEVVPASNAVVPESPTEIRVTFSEPVSLNGGSTEVLDDAGEPVSSEARIADNTVVVDLAEPLADGTYVVAWRVISADSHPVSGTSIFSVGAPSVGAPVDVDLGSQVPAVVSAWRVLAMAVTYGGVLASVGMWWFARRWHRLAADLAADDDIADETDETDDGIIGAFQRLDRWQVWAAIIGIVGIVLAFPARLIAVGGGWDSISDGSFVTDTLTGPIGQATLATIVGTAGLAIWRPSRLGSSTIVVGLACSIVALGGFALEGHTRTKEPTWLIVLSDIVHTAAGSVWLGGVVALALLLPRTFGPWRARIALDVSSWALWSVVAISIAGLAMSMIVLETFNALADTGYGLALLVKLGLVVVLVAIGARSRMVLVPAIEASEMSGDPRPAEQAVRGLRRSVAVELVVFAALLLATATLVGRSPVVASDEVVDGEHATSGAGEPVTVPLSTGVGTVTITLDPGSVGGNMLMLTLADDDGAPLALVEPPTVQLREESRGIGPLELVPDEVSSGNYHAIADVPFAGTWEVSVRARTSTFDSALATTVFVVDD